MPTCTVSVQFRASAVHPEAPGGWGAAPIYPKHTSAGATPLSPSSCAPPCSRYRHSTKCLPAPTVCDFAHVTPANRHQAAGGWLGVGGKNGHVEAGESRKATCNGSKSQLRQKSAFWSLLSTFGSSFEPLKISDRRTRSQGGNQRRHQVRFLGPLVVLIPLPRDLGGQHTCAPV